MDNVKLTLYLSNGHDITVIVSRADADGIKRAVNQQATGAYEPRVPGGALLIPWRAITYVKVHDNA